MSRLLNELNTFYLELLQIDSDEDMIGYERVDVNAVIDEVIAEFPGKYRARERVVVDIHDNVRPIRINRNALKLILLNVVENALLYAQVATPIRVEVERAREQRGMGEGHVLNKAANLKDYWKRVLAFFDEHLKGAGEDGPTPEDE